VELGTPRVAVVVGAGFWSGRRVLVTGHTGFKGSWLTLWLITQGASVTGFADALPTDPSLHELIALDREVAWVRGDVRDAAAVSAAVRDVRPDVIFHLAAQPFVRRSYREPRRTYEVNIMGTVNVLQAAHEAPTTRVVINVTSDKCYANRGVGRPFVESDPMGGDDPYSSSKACAELVADAYRASFFAEPSGPRLASVRAGNVFAGGDWGEDRLVPDLMRGALSGAAVPVRRPDAVRPWQHVLNPLAGYLRVAEVLCTRPEASGAWNFGPENGDARSVAWIVGRVRELWPYPLDVREDRGPHPRESGYLMLDSGKARAQLGWRPVWDLDEGLRRTVEWYEALAARRDIRATTIAQIDAFAGALSRLSSAS